MHFPTIRLRRLRANKVLRNLVQETRLHLQDCILPLFIRHGNESRAINSMPGHKQLSLKDLSQEIRLLKSLGIQSVILFGIPKHKDAIGSDSYSDHGIIQAAIKVIKDTYPEMFVITDVCFCEYTDHGHCGFIDEKHHLKEVDNDKTLALIAKQALSHAKAGADMLAPSGNMDGMVGAIRNYLDEHDFSHMPILSYSVKYASSLYGPFREAAEGTPQFGDRSSYQMNPANISEAIREAELDIQEGADLLMIKPAGFYLDVIHHVKEHFSSLPLCAYQVSGEFAMIKAAAAQGWIDEKKVALESLLSIKRAGANFIITYFTKDIAGWL